MNLSGGAAGRAQREGLRDRVGGLLAVEHGGGDGLAGGREVAADENARVRTGRIVQRVGRGAGHSVTPGRPAWRSGFREAGADRLDQHVGRDREPLPGTSTALSGTKRPGSFQRISTPRRLSGGRRGGRRFGDAAVGLEADALVERERLLFDVGGQLLHRFERDGVDTGGAEALGGDGAVHRDGATADDHDLLALHGAWRAPRGRPGSCCGSGTRPTGCTPRRSSPGRRRR